MLGQAASLINRLMQGRISGAPWQRTVRKGVIFKAPTAAFNRTSARRNIFSAYPTNMKKALIQNAKRELAAKSYFIRPSQAFQDAYNRLFLKSTTGAQEAMFFMYNPTTWSRTVKSGYEEIRIPGGESVFHQASVPPQTFSLELLLDNSLWNNSDSLFEALADHAVGALSRGVGESMGQGDLGLRELQFYHYPTDAVDPFFSKPGMTNFASLAPVINWYEMLCRPDVATQKCPEVFVAYQDMFARCIVESCTTSILKSDWRQNINRAQVSLNFIVIENLNLDKGMVQGEQDLLTATQGF